MLIVEFRFYLAWNNHTMLLWFLSCMSYVILCRCFASWAFSRLFYFKRCVTTLCKIQFCIPRFASIRMWRTSSFKARNSPSKCFVVLKKYALCAFSLFYLNNNDCNVRKGYDYIWSYSDLCPNELHSRKLNLSPFCT